MGMEEIWSFTNTFFVIMHLCTNAAILFLFYKAYLKATWHAVAVASMFALTMIMLYLIPYEMSGTLAYGTGVVAAGVAAFLLEKNNPWQKVFLGVTVYLLLWISTLVADVAWNWISALTYGNQSYRDNSDLQYVLFLLALTIRLVLENLILFLEVTIIHKIDRKKEDNLSLSEFTMLISPYLAIMLGHLLVSFLLRAYENDLRQYVWNNHQGYLWIDQLYKIVSFMAIVTSIWAFQKIKSAHQMSVENALVSRQVQDIRNHIQSVELYYGDIRGMRHDINNHLMILSGFIQQEDMSQAKEYLSRLKTELVSQRMLVNTGNPITDIILSEKKREAESRGVAFSSHFQYPANMEMDAFDLSIILSNALNNAIEATQKRNERINETIVESKDLAGRQNTRFIEITSKTNKNTYFIIVKNSFEGNLEWDRESKLPRSTKKEKESHGYGLKNIKRIAEKYFGTIDLQKQNDVVELTVMLMLRTKE